VRETGIWLEVLPLVKANARPLSKSLLLGFLASFLTVVAQLLWQHATVFSRDSWFRNFGLPVAWIGIWKKPGGLLETQLNFYWSTFLQNWLFWIAVIFALLFVYSTVRGQLTLALLPVYVLSLSYARILLELQMAVAVMGSIYGYAHIDPFSYAQIMSYFAMALLLFPVIVTIVSGLPYAELLRMSSLGFPIILMPPFIDHYVLRQPVIYNFFSPESHGQITSPFAYLTILSAGIKFEIVLVSVLVVGYLLYRTRSVLRSVAAVMAAVFVFALVSTPALTSRLGIGFTQPQLYAGYLIIIYALVIASIDLFSPHAGCLVLRRTRLRGIHFPAMVLFGTYFVHPTLISAISPEHYGPLIVSVLIAFWTWQAAIVFDDVSESHHKTGLPTYLVYGELMALMALLSAIPFGPLPWLLVCVAVYFAVEYPRLRRKHYLLSGLIIGASTSAAFLFGALIPITGQKSSQPAALLALLLLTVFSGGSLLKDIGSVEEDKRSGIETVFTKLKQSRILPIVATFVAAGCALPVLFLNLPLDLILFAMVASSAWLLMMKKKEKSYKLVLGLYFIEGLWVFLRIFVVNLA